MKKRRNRRQEGSVFLDPRTKIWSFRYRDACGKRKAERIGNMKQFPTKSKAKEAAEPFRLRINSPEAESGITLEKVAQRYVLERMPSRHSTSRGYRGKLKIVLSKWGAEILPLKPHKVEAWLKSLKSNKGTLYSKKSREHIKSMLFMLHDAAVFFEYLSADLRNPMELVRVLTVPGAPKTRERIILSMEEFRGLLAEIPEEPYHLMVLFAACLGLRMSEIFALGWGDFDLLRNEVHIQRGIVEGYVDDTKTTSSNSKLPLHPMIVEALLSWRQQSPFNSDDDYVFASPVILGKKPLNANSAQQDYLRPASIRAGLKPIGFHALRHSYRTWLDEVGSGPMVQKELMRHSTISMTMDGYGRGVPEANREANSRLVGQLLNEGSVQ
jgi:integrase